MEGIVRAKTRSGLILALSIFLTFAVLPLSACDNDDAATAQEPRVVTLGIVQSLTGAGGVYGKTVVEGIDLAIKQLNAAQHDTGVRFEYTVADDQSAAAASTAAFADLIARDVDVLIGPTLSNVASEDHRLAQRAGIPVIGVTTTAAGITDTGDYVFRLALPEAVVVPAAIARVAQQAPIKQAVLIVDGNDAFSLSSAVAMRAGLTAAGGSMLAEIDVAKTDIAAELGRLQGQSFDAFLVTPLVDTAAAALKAIRSAGFQQVVIGGNSFNTLDIARLAGPAAEGAYVGAAWNPGVSSATSRAFVQAYTQAYGHAPDQFAAQGYTTIYVLADAIRRAGPDNRAAIRDALAATRDLDTPLGVLSISGKREAVHTSVVQQYRNGRLAVIE